MIEPAPLALVPIVVNVGASTLPALLAGLASVAAVLLHPREWPRRTRERPWRFIGFLGLVAAALGTWALWPEDAPDRGIDRRSPLGIDWTWVAIEHLEERAVEVDDADAADLTDPARPTSTSDSAADAPSQHTGYHGGPSPAALRPAWRFIDPEDDAARTLGRVALHSGRLYAASSTQGRRSTTGAVMSLDAESGHLRWITREVPIPDPPGSVPMKGFFSSPAVTADGRYVVIGEGIHEDRGSSLLCLDAATGRVVWRLETPLHIESSPAIEGDRVVVGVGAIEDGEDEEPPAGDDAGFVVAVRISTGEELWRHRVIDAESSPAIADGITYIGSGVHGNALIALRMDDEASLTARGLGRELWRTELPYPAVSAVSLIDDLAVIGCGRGNFLLPDREPAGMVVAVDRRSGAIRWQIELPDTVLAPIAVRDGVALVPCRNGEVWAIELAGPRVRWHSSIHGDSPVLAGAGVTDSLGYAVSRDGTLAVFTPADGAILERHPINRPGRPGVLGLSVSGPVIADGRVYLGSETGGIIAMEGRPR